MKTLTMKFSQLIQIVNYFKEMENNSKLNFSKRRKLIHLNEELDKEFGLFKQEMNKIMDEFCEKDEEGNFITMDNGSNKIIPEKINECNDVLLELYNTEFEINYEPMILDEELFDNLSCDASTIKLIENSFLTE